MTESEIREELAGLHSQLQKIREQERGLGKQIVELREKLIVFTCPYEVGTRFASRYYHAPVEITRIQAARESYSGSDGRFLVFGREVLKNGSLHKTEREITHWVEKDYKDGKID